MFDDICQAQVQSTSWQKPQTSPIILPAECQEDKSAVMSHTLFESFLTVLPQGDSVWFHKCNKFTNAKSYTEITLLSK